MISLGGGRTDSRLVLWGMSCREDLSMGLIPLKSLKI